MKRSPPGKPNTSLPGIHVVPKRLADGKWRVHVYAYRGGPSIGTFQGDTREAALNVLRRPEIAAKLAASYAAGTRPEETKAITLADILHLYEASEKFRKKSESTKLRERRPLEEIRRSRMGSLPEKALASKRIRFEIEVWRTEIAETQGPRAADVRVGLISKALTWAIRYGHASSNPAFGVEHLSNPDRSDVTLTGSDLVAFEKAARAARFHSLTKKQRAHGDPPEPPAIVLATLLLCLSGLRREDACNLTWEMVQGNALVLRPLKSLRRARTAGKARQAPTVIIPITPELRVVLVHCGLNTEKRGPWVLTNSLGRKWTPGGLTTSFINTRDRAGLADAQGRKKRLHDCRGTFVTHMRIAGYPIDQIATMVGWPEEDVDALAKRYVDADRIALSMLERLNRNVTGT